MAESICLQCQNDKGWEDKVSGGHIFDCLVQAFPSKEKQKCLFFGVHPDDCQCERCFFERCRERTLNEEIERWQ